MTAVDLDKLPISLYTCAPNSKLPSYICTIQAAEFLYKSDQFFNSLSSEGQAAADALSRHPFIPSLGHPYHQSSRLSYMPFLIQAFIYTIHHPCIYSFIYAFLHPPIRSFMISFLRPGFLASPHLFIHIISHP